LAERKRALVLGGGGPVGRAWASGLASGLAAEGVMLRSAELILGTSAGAILGAQLGLGLDLAVTAPLPGQTAMAPRPSIDMAQLVKTMAQASQSAAPEVERRDIGRMALVPRHSGYDLLAVLG